MTPDGCWEATVGLPAGCLTIVGKGSVRLVSEQGLEDRIEKTSLTVIFQLQFM